MTSTEYKVTGMTCAHCEMSVKEEVSQLDGVDNVQVSSSTGKLVITAPQPLDDAAVLAAVEEAGYTAERLG